MKNRLFKRMIGNVLRKVAGLPPIVAVVMVFVICSPQLAAAQAWSPWLDRDDPSGKGDYETVADFIKAGKICDKPIQIQCRFIGETNPWPANAPTGYTCNTELGGYCVNEPGLECRDIEVRFLCPKGLEGRTPTAAGTPSEKPKAGETTAHIWPDSLALKEDPKPTSHKGCRVIARPWDSGDPGWKYPNYWVSFVLVSGPGKAPDKGQADTNGVLERSVIRGQTIRAVLGDDSQNPERGVVSTDFTCISADAVE